MRGRLGLLAPAIVAAVPGLLALLAVTRAAGSSDAPMNRPPVISRIKWGPLTAGVSDVGPPSPAPYLSDPLAAVIPTVRFRWPMRLPDWWYVSNYVDLDPASPGRLDWNCSDINYDGHTGIDVGIRDFVEMDEGRFVLAAAEGTVEYVADGFFDRNTTGAYMRSNYVLVRHTDGTQVYYVHLAKWSTLVQVGEHVFEGQPIGLIGSSGPSTDPHLHFEVQNAGAVYEPFAGACNPGDSLWKPPQASHVSAEPVQLFDYGITHIEPDYQSIKIPPANIFRTRQSGVTPHFFWYKLASVHPSDESRLIYRTPAGSLYADYSFAHGFFSGVSWFLLQVDLPASGSLGTWNVEYRLNGAVAAATSFLYTSAFDQPPVATGRTVTVAKGRAKEALRGSDLEGDINGFSLASGPAHGEVVLYGPRNSLFSYVPDSGYGGADSFQFQVEDGQGGLSSPATLTLDVTPHVSNALRLEGEQDYVSVPASASLDLTGPFTLEAWIRRAPGSSEYQAIIDRRHPMLLDGYGYYLLLTWDNKLVFHIGDGGFGGYAYSSTPIPVGRWTHVAATWDGTWMRLFTDGRQEPSPGFFAGPVSYAGVGETRLGGSFYPSGEEGFRGEIEEVRIWGVARTEAELRQGASCSFFESPVPSSVRALWRFQGSAADSSGNGNHGTRVAGASFLRTDPAFPLVCLIQDLDADGRADGADNCPLTSNPTQIDSDADAVGDSCDVCAGARDPHQLDTDLDGAGDVCDSCPFLGNTEQADADGDGSGDLCDPAPSSGSVGIPSGQIVLDLTHNRVTGTTSLIWNPEPRSASYELFRGTAAEVRARFYGVCQKSRDPDTTDTTFADNQSPPPGDAFFYLVTGVSAGGLRGLAGLDSSGRQRDLRAKDCL